MKVGIITIHHSPNYGACLQSFALYEYLHQAGYDVEIIDLHRPCYADYQPSRRFRPYGNRETFSLRAIARWLRSSLRKPCETAPHQDKEAPVPSRKLINPAFDIFNARIRLSRPYRGIDELYANPPAYDVYITGSDQVWNPTQSYCLEPYFLTFVREGRRISYAPSVGIEELTAREKRDFRKWLRYYDAVSVRESQAQKLLEAVAGCHIEQVADPTFLLDIEYWEALSVKPAEQNYILLFMLDYDQRLFEYAQRLSQESGKRLIVLGPARPEPAPSGILTASDASPEEFVGYIACADLVITDSFHCTVFSILMGATQFYTYIAPWNERGSRIRDLLHTFHLDGHLLDGGLNQSMDELESRIIDRAAVLEINHREQEKSRCFLKDNI